MSNPRTTRDNARERRRKHFEALGEQNRVAEEAARREMWWDMARTAVLCFVWCFAGLALVGLSMHLVGPTAIVWFWAGLIVGNGGILFALARLYHRGANRGDW